MAETYLYETIGNQRILVIRLVSFPSFFICYHSEDPILLPLLLEFFYKCGLQMIAL
jgi:hypothetical protein